MKKVRLEMVEKENRMDFFKYLLLADESEEVVKQYVYDGDMFSIHYENRIAGVVLFTLHQNQVVELKNIGLDRNFRGSGIGKIVLLEAYEKYAGMHKMVVGTANSSIGNLAFYQKAGFRIIGVKKDFFLHYPQPIFENGIRAMDMVMFEKELKLGE
ncbi:GNAT family N-acetyltransferase [Ornithinibacillus salinisoli]|uniref:GNAT family N-acetyltransferase n=1 Tax=Ornithinibacillus salinisoli TaxID=1848459 RepID=A0ABW4W0Y1_9BACI